MGGPAWGGGLPLQRLTTKRLREASLQFKRRTSWTYDGFHRRHFAMLCDDALMVVAILLEIYECVGTIRMLVWDNINLGACFDVSPFTAIVAPSSIESTLTFTRIDGLLSTEY